MSDTATKLSPEALAAALDEAEMNDEAFRQACAVQPEDMAAPVEPVGDPERLAAARDLRQGMLAIAGGSWVKS